MQIVNISGYKFVELLDVEALRERLAVFCDQQQLKGTILLSQEGTNQVLAGTRAQIEAYKAFLFQDPRFNDICFKESFSTQVPFKRMRVKIKPEIITMGLPNLSAQAIPTKRVSPRELKQWLDEHRDVALLDTRNQFEVDHGTFEEAIHLEIHQFSEFPQVIPQLDEGLKKKPVVIFCTGGVRCEKAAVSLAERGFSEVYQLDGGILNYFEQCGGAHWQGDCFVFDGRITLNPQLEPTNL